MLFVGARESMNTNRLLLLAAANSVLVCALISCGSHHRAPSTGTPTEKPKLGAPEDVPTGLCSTPELTPNRATERTHFDYAAKRCGCWNRRLSCVSHSSLECFFRGTWYPTNSVQTVKGVSHRCDGFGWMNTQLRITVEPPQEIYPWVSFSGDEKNLNSDQLIELTEQAAAMKGNPRLTLAIVPHVKHLNDKREKELAQLRAKNVREAFLAAGVEPHRVTIGEATVAGLNGVRLHFVEK